MYVVFSGVDGLVDVKFIDDGIKETVTYDCIENCMTLQTGDIRYVKWEDGKYYEAIILTISKFALLIQEP